MALKYSNMMELGTVAPDFKLLDTVSNQTQNLQTLKGQKATVITFICNHCPFVHHINSKLVEVANRFQAQGIQFIAISSNSVKTHPQDGPEQMKIVAKKEKYSFPYLYDESQEVAKAYGAECTPDFFVFDEELRCVYRGRFDDTRPGNGVATGEELSNALQSIIDGKSISQTQQPSMGCSIKWES